MSTVSLCNSFQKCERNSLSRSETIFRAGGRLFSQYQWSKKRQAIFSAVRDVVLGMIRMSEPRRSVKITMELYPSSSGSGPTKSMATESHLSSGTGKGCKGPIGLDVSDLFLGDRHRSERMLSLGPCACLGNRMMNVVFHMSFVCQNVQGGHGQFDKGFPRFHVLQG